MARQECAANSRQAQWPWGRCSLLLCSPDLVSYRMSCTQATRRAELGLEGPTQSSLPKAILLGMLQTLHRENMNPILLRPAKDLGAARSTENLPETHLPHPLRISRQ